MMTDIPLFGEPQDITPEGACSRCGMAYGAWELSVKWSRITETKTFVHMPGFQWKMPENKKDFGPQLRESGVVPSNANIARMQ
jgi:hypothetical protein